MKKKIFAVLLLTALISSALTVLGICFVLNLDAKSAINLGRFLSAMNFIELQYVQDVDKDKLIDGAISGMVRSLGDPHSVYLEPKLYSQLKADTSGAFGGLAFIWDSKITASKFLTSSPTDPATAAA